MADDKQSLVVTDRVIFNIILPGVVMFEITHEKSVADITDRPLISKQA